MLNGTFIKSVFISEPFCSTKFVSWFLSEIKALAQGEQSWRLPCSKVMYLSFPKSIRCKGVVKYVLEYSAVFSGGNMQVNNSDIWVGGEISFFSTKGWTMNHLGGGLLKKWGIFSGYSIGSHHHKACGVGWLKTFLGKVNLPNLIGVPFGVQKLKKL